MPKTVRKITAEKYQNINRWPIPSFILAGMVDKPSMFMFDTTHHWRWPLLAVFDYGIIDVWRWCSVLRKAH